MPSEVNGQVVENVVVSNFPTTQPVSGTVSVSNLPATQPVSGTVALAAGTAAVGSVSVSNLPATQAVSAAAAAFADGSDATIGAKGDAAVTSPTASGSLIALTKGLLSTLGSALGITAAVNAFAVGALADGANVVEGKTTDAPLAAAASATASTFSSAFKGLFNLFFNGIARIVGCQWWTEVSGSSVAANGSVTGTARTNPAATSGSTGFAGYFTALVYSTQAGTLGINNGVANWTAAVAANTVTSIKVPALGASFTSQFVMGSTAGTVSLLDGFTTA